MNPELQAPNFNPEQQPINHEHGETLPGPEQAGERSPEREQNMQAVDRASAPAVPVVVPIPFPQPVTPQPVATPSADDTNPAMAGDDDLIEKEWVDKAKKIIVETRDDPYKREREVNKLQIDYLRKRYGKELGATDD